jgi:hypothetical protein
MCVYSAIMDNQKGIWGEPSHPFYPYTTNPIYTYPPDVPTREEFDKLKVEIEELKKLLIAAKEFDENTGQKDCEAEDKVALLKRIADALGVDISAAL